MFEVKALQGLVLQPWSHRELWEGEGSSVKPFHGMKSWGY